MSDKRILILAVSEAKFLKLAGKQAKQISQLAIFEGVVSAAEGDECGNVLRSSHTPTMSNVSMFGVCDALANNLLHWRIRRQETTQKKSEGRN